MRLRIEYGTGNEVAKEFPAGCTIGQAGRDKGIQAVLGYGDKVAFHVGGRCQDESTPAAEGMVIRVHNAATEKQRDRRR